MAQRGAVGEEEDAEQHGDPDGVDEDHERRVPLEQLVLVGVAADAVVPPHVGPTVVQVLAREHAEHRPGHAAVHEERHQDRYRGVLLPDDGFVVAASQAARRAPAQAAAVSPDRDDVRAREDRERRDRPEGRDEQLVVEVRLEQARRREEPGQVEVEQADEGEKSLIRLGVQDVADVGDLYRGRQTTVN